MLRAIGVDRLEDLAAATVPDSIRSKERLSLEGLPSEPLGEHDLLVRADPPGLELLDEGTSQLRGAVLEEGHELEEVSVLVPHLGASAGRSGALP